MARNYDDEFIRDLYSKIADFNPTLITERKASRYSREYYKYHNIKIAITRDSYDNTVTSISITKM